MHAQYVGGALKKWSLNHQTGLSVDFWHPGPKVTQQALSPVPEAHVTESEPSAKWTL